MPVEGWATAVGLLGLLASPAGAADQIRADGTVDFARYHDSAEAAQLLRELVARYGRGSSPARGTPR